MPSPRENPRRAFIRHTANVPISVNPVESGARTTGQGVNVSYGGLAFTAEACLEPGSTVEVRIDEVTPPFEARARVAWCRPEASAFLVGVEFLEPSDAFRVRMVQQVCTIEQYRRDVLEREGRELDPAVAAAEWIERYGGRFPDA